MFTNTYGYEIHKRNTLVSKLAPAYLYKLLVIGLGYKVLGKEEAR